MKAFYKEYQWSIAANLANSHLKNIKPQIRCVCVTYECVFKVVLSRWVKCICTYRLFFAERMGAVSLRMGKHALIFMLNLLCNAATVSGSNCKSHDFADPFEGRYSPTEGIITTISSWPQCKLFCLRTPSCQSVNCNFTNNICTYFTATCTKAISHPGMAFVLFTGTPSQQCMEWIPTRDADPPGDRSVTEDSIRIVARMQKDGNDFVGYWLMYDLSFYAMDDRKQFYGYSCQYLRIRDGCTVHYMNYEFSAPLPLNALIGGYTVDGLPVYIGINDANPRPGYYIHGSNRLAAGNGFATKNVKLLVSL